MNFQEFPKYSKADCAAESKQAVITTAAESSVDEAVELEEALEGDLCLLWDMTADKDVALCVFNNDIVQLSHSFLKESQAPRLNVIYLFLFLLQMLYEF